MDESESMGFGIVGLFDGCGRSFDSMSEVDGGPCAYISFSNDSPRANAASQLKSVILLLTPSPA